jgi:hypothetical protein
LTSASSGLPVKKSVVYVFGCLEEGCNAGKGSWRVFRWTCIEPSTSEDPEDEESKGESQCGQIKVDSWGLEEDEDELDGTFDLSSIRDQLKSLTSEIPKQKQQAPRDAPTTLYGTSVFDGFLPNFYLVESAVIPLHHTGSSTRQDSDDSDSDNDRDHADGRLAAGNGCGDDAEDTGEAGVVTWEGEAYEPDSILRTSGREAPDTLFLKFMKDLSRHPDQCIRLYHVPPGGAKTIPYAWPVAQDEIQQQHGCDRCGSERVCMLQIMSPIISAVLEAREMAIEEGIQELVVGTKLPPSSWSWAVLHVTVCSNLCMDDKNFVFIEECIESLGDA